MVPSILARLLPESQGHRRKHRQVMRKHLAGSGVRTRVEKVMALLVESGVVYVLIWVRWWYCAHHSLLLNPS
ncbi:hypothetical protein DICSQDRAFT_71566 [Dichomitus squalens LYAD-421 SS1]|uniref:Uncharacterized protein n=1 Tax=Dichomitus squalens (strain LYAD-421) TaxID=732165 RepID=R7SJN5_DICSQ|nr:uncharacterized protein DICSQDRAFT_71566 [Dichomitus squalens LYAD-421 SS1]EJF56366.1 hypothetical protein DICSQDRAFT_71566 [Dichomitus squalens LYAD-421 SS1]